ncbi:MAG: transglutaminase-like domain-containing protein [Eubacteriales bacterium]|nr:transglutaminase-like domain-containing protein [Eubacteriales bacterium]
MQLIRENCPYEDYLAAQSPVNADEPRVSFVAEHLMGRLSSQLDNPDGALWSDPETALVQLTYEYVRDKIKNSTPTTSGKMTWRASEVLNEKEGTCYSKANLIAALLRKNGITTGFVYQYLRETVDGPLVLHALNAVYLESLGGWVRLDASYTPDSTRRSPLEQAPAEFAVVDPDALIRPVRPELGEDNLPIVYAKPDAQIASLFKQATSLQELWAKRPSRLSGGDHDHHPASSSQATAQEQQEADDSFLDVLYGDPDDEEFSSCSGGCSGCSGGCSIG